MINFSKVKKHLLSNEKGTASQQWMWFLGLYILGFIALTSSAYFLKGLMSFL
ncbi:hypothetical protein [Marinomonas sp. 2405UD68-3]|uniref:hypothetical protein n=1 Tax=Marinomonas sp. 2405UD68-3 TaxID=3391835 RepID=UPI0039C8DB3E